MALVLRRLRSPQIAQFLNDPDPRIVLEAARAINDEPIEAAPYLLLGHVLDELVEARRRGTQKTVLERKAPPTFDVVLEIQRKDRLAVHHDVGEVIDLFLRGEPLAPEVRVRTKDGEVEIGEPEPREPTPPRFPGTGASAPGAASGDRDLRRLQRRVRLFPYAVSRGKLERAMRKLHAPVRIVDDLREADLVAVAHQFGVKRPERILGGTRAALADWERHAAAYDVPQTVVTAVRAELDKRAKILAG